MAQPATNAKIEELRFRVKTDPKSRLFYPLAEELRKAGQVSEAEQVLRTGLTAHGAYLSAWVSLGRVLRDQKKDGEAVEALTKALQLDPGNVVAARLLADAYLSLGEKVEAIKKYKLVHALLPADEELEAQIAVLEQDLHGTPADVTPPMEAAEPAPDVGDDTYTEPPIPTIETPFEDAVDRTQEEARIEESTGDAEPMLASHDESPFEEPVSGYTAAALTVEAPVGMHIDEAPLAAEMPAPPPEEADVFAPVESIPVVEDGTTLKIRKLENWLSRVSRREVRSV